MKDAITKEGTILGTLHYMAPEQLEGKETDARTDIFAFGVVLYEMITGMKAFTGKSQASVIAAILERQPEPISKLLPLTPPALDRMVRTCLAKDADERWQTAHDLNLQLKWTAESESEAGSTESVVGRRKSREHLAWTVTAIALLGWLAFGMVAWLRSKPTAPADIVRTALTLPGGFNVQSLAISPDGRTVALAGSDTSGQRMLWLRALDSIEARVLPDTEEAAYPFWSPDSRFLGYFAGGKLKKIEASGGPPRTVCDAVDGRGGTWGPDGMIVFSPTINRPLQRVTAAGGTPVDLTRAESSIGSHIWPEFLPGGTHVLFLARRTISGVGRQGAISVVTVRSGESRLLIPGDHSNVAYALGHLIFVRGGKLMAQAFDPRRLELEGEPFAVPQTEAIQFDLGQSLGIFSVSTQGTLVYSPGSHLLGSQLVWRNRAGDWLGAVGDPADQHSPLLSPDGQRALVTISDASSGQTDLWIYDLSREDQRKSRFTFDPSNELAPAWSPDGASIVFGSDRKGRTDFYRKSASGAGMEVCLLESQWSILPTSWSRDGQFLLYHEIDPQTRGDVWVLPMNEEPKPYPLLKTRFDEGQAQFSPDGKWIVYHSEESGRYEVYVAAFPKLSGKWQVSAAGGTQPRWAGNGQEIFYIAPNYWIMVAEVRTSGEAFEVGPIRPLFSMRVGNPIRPYDATSDGQKFLVNTTLEQTNNLPVMVVQNWAAELKKK